MKIIIMILEKNRTYRIFGDDIAIYKFFVKIPFLSEVWKEVYPEILRKYTETLYVRTNSISSKLFLDTGKERE